MTDSLKERLRARKAFGLNGSRWMMLVDPDEDCREALARIEELEAESQENWQKYVDANEALIDAQATIAKLEKENLNLHRMNDTQATTIERLQSELSGRLGQPFGDPAKS